MKILYYREQGRLLPAVQTKQGVIAITELLPNFKSGENPAAPMTIDELEEIQKALSSISQHTSILPDVSALEIGPCVPRPPKIICIGLNYRKHAEESGMAIPVVPVVFTKYANTLTNFGYNVPLGNEGEQFDYEVELGVIVGKKCKNVLVSDALEYVLGYCVANDLSCRDLQFKTSQWLLGKSLDSFLPLGKYFVTADEISDPQNLQLSCSLNGELRQNSNTADMIFSVAEIIAFLSRHMTLEPGDLILTGTPQGVIMGLPNKEWLKQGDVVTVEIEKLGYTTNKLV